MENKKTYEELKEELNNLYKDGKIDKFFYEKELQKIQNKINEKNKRERANKKEKIKSKGTILLVILIILTAIIILSFLLSQQGTLYGRDYEEVESFDRLPSPIQKISNGGTTLKMGDTKFHVDFLYSYTMYARVADTYTYKKTDTHNKLVPKDIAVMWGPLAQDRFFDDIEVFSTGSRTAYFRFKNPEVYPNVGNVYFSNNHLVPANEEIAKLIDKIDRNHFIKIEGYLCEITGKFESRSYYQSVLYGLDYNDEYIGGEYFTSSSTTREDLGCETIYVTDVKWLKEK